MSFSFLKLWVPQEMEKVPDSVFLAHIKVRILYTD